MSRPRKSTHYDLSDREATQILWEFPDPGEGFLHMDKPFHRIKWNETFGADTHYTPRLVYGALHVDDTIAVMRSGKIYYDRILSIIEGSHYDTATFKIASVEG